MDFDDTLFHQGISGKAIDAILDTPRRVRIGVMSGSSIESIRNRAPNHLIECLDFIGSSNGALITERGKVIEQIAKEQLEILRMIEPIFLGYQRYGLKVIPTGYSFGLLTQDACIIEELEQTLNMFPSIHISRWATGIGAVLIEKDEALRRYCTSLDCEPMALAIGDSENDLPMFSFARATGGHACVVGNSSLQDERISYRAKAHYGEGVAEIFARFI